MLKRHALFNKLPGVFSKTFGEPNNILFDLEDEDLAVKGVIIRELNDDYNNQGGGSGTIGSVVTIAMPTELALQIPEGTKFTYQDQKFSVASEFLADGRGMSKAEAEKVE